MFQINLAAVSFRPTIRAGSRTWRWWNNRCLHERSNNERWYTLSCSGDRLGCLRSIAKPLGTICGVLFNSVFINCDHESEHYTGTAKRMPMRSWWGSIQGNFVWGAYASKINWYCRRQDYKFEKSSKKNWQNRNKEWKELITGRL